VCGSRSVVVQRGQLLGVVSLPACLLACVQSHHVPCNCVWCCVVRFLCAPSKKDYEEWIEVIKKASVVRKAMRKLHADSKQDKTKQERLAKLRERMAANEAAIATQKNTQELQEDILGTIRFIGR
jgi:NAD kinase